MKVVFSLLVVVFVAVNGTAQSDNIFLSRTYWKGKPSVENVRQMVESGNNPVEMNGSAFDAVVWAILEDAEPEILDYLLSLEGNAVNKVTHDKRSYLLWAAYKGNLSLMKKLVEMGADVGWKDDFGYGLLTFTAVGGVENQAVYEFIFDHGGSVNEVNHDGANALHLLVPKLSDTAFLNYLVSKGFDLKGTDKKGNNAFMYAARMGNLRVMDFLMHAGVDPQLKNKLGSNAVEFAAKGYRGHVNQYEVFHYLKMQSLDFSVVNEKGETALHWLAKSQKDEAVFRLFMDAGLDVNQADEQGNTPFLVASRFKNMVAMKFLAKHGSNVFHRNENDLSSASYSARNASLEQFELLAAFGYDWPKVESFDADLWKDVFEGYQSKNSADFWALVEVLKPRKLNAHAQNREGASLYHLSVEKKEVSLVELAYQLRSPINSKNQLGLTPLHLAAMKGSDDRIMKQLIAFGADVTIETEFGESAFDLAKENELIDQKIYPLEFLQQY